jgi:hypothetical protein
MMSGLTSAYLQYVTDFTYKLANMFIMLRKFVYRIHDLFAGRSTAPAVGIPLGWNADDACEQGATAHPR